jgi:hypothetical protein
MITFADIAHRFSTGGQLAILQRIRAARPSLRIEGRGALPAEDVAVVLEQAGETAAAAMVRDVAATRKREKEQASELSVEERARRAGPGVYTADDLINALECALDMADEGGDGKRTCELWDLGRGRAAVRLLTPEGPKHFGVTVDPL